MLFQVCRELRRQQTVIKSNLVLKGDLDTWLHQKKTWKVSPYNAIRGRLLSDLCTSRRLVERDMDHVPNSVTEMEVNNDLLVWLTVGGAALGELLKCHFQTWLKYIKTTRADAHLQVGLCSWFFDLLLFGFSPPPSTLHSKCMEKTRSCRGDVETGPRILVGAQRRARRAFICVLTHVSAHAQCHLKGRSWIRRKINMINCYLFCP